MFMNLRKYLQIRHLYLITLMLLTACGGSDDVKKTPALSFAESSIPVDDLSVDGGSVNIDVEWANTKWNVSAGDVVEGNAFITTITPSYAGSENQGPATTTVKITFAANNAPVKNRQTLTLKSTTGSLSQSITLTQAAKVVEPINITIDPATTYQTIAGFGGGNTMWGTNYLTASQLKTAFGTDDTDLGLTIFRVRLSSVQSDWSSLVSTLQEAKTYNVKILASPWSPPANLKSNDNVIGGYLLEAKYPDYATYLNDFVQYMDSEGVTIDVVSIQNEPDWDATYESCNWTATQVYNFIKNNAGAITGTKVAAAESLRFDQAYTNAILNDPVAVDNLDIVAGHLYGGGLAPYPLAEQKGKEIWMTEYLMNLNSTSSWSTMGEDVKWNETMQMLGTIHDAMTDNWNAYIWWYIRRYYSFIGDGEQGTTLGTPLKRGYAMSQFAKFVRPGYVRIGTQSDTSEALDMTAYTGDNKVVVVMINSENYALTDVNLSIPNTITGAEAYSTSLSLNRDKTVLSPSDKQVTVDLPAFSITTVVMSY